MTFLEGCATDKYKTHSFSVLNIHVNIHFRDKIAIFKILLLLKQLLNF